VTHPAFETELDAYLDGELTAADARDLEAHLARCAECARFRDERLALRAAITSRIPSVAAPDALRDRVRAALAAEARPEAPPRRRVSSYWRAVAIAASLVIVAVGSWNLALRKASADRVTEAVLASHVRSLMPGHLTDVPSSDQHTVKPWFNGKLDFSPPVHDLAAQGYPLLGGRLDYVDGRSVAVLVYRRRQHLINVFVWPATRGPSGAPRASDRQGYHLLHWATPDYTFLVVSDLGLAELDDFARLLQRADSTGVATSPR
jgi:anti-sigma factor RsiW